MQHQTKTVEYLLEASEFDWEIAPGKTIPAWGFNNQVPGPLLNANKGDTLVVKVKTISMSLRSYTGMASGYQPAWMVPVTCKSPFSRAKPSNTALWYRMRVPFGTIRITMKRYKWNGVCMAALSLKMKPTL